MTLRERILTKYRKSRHFKERVSERDISNKEILLTLNEGIERRLMGDRVRYLLNDLIIIASSTKFSLITAYKREALSRQQRKKAGLVSTFNNGSGRSKRHSLEYRKRKRKFKE